MVKILNTFKANLNIVECNMCGQWENFTQITDHNLTLGSDQVY
jgi:hypothetical protein